MNYARFFSDIVPDGARCVCTGYGADSVDGTLDRAIDLCRDERGYAHYAALTVTVFRMCERCDGNGRKRRPRHKWTYDECKACRGDGAFPVAMARVQNTGVAR